MRLKGKKESENSKTNRPSKEGQRFLTVGSKQILEPVKAGPWGRCCRALRALRVVEEMDRNGKGWYPTPSALQVFSRRSLSVENEMGTCDWNGYPHSLLFPLESLA